MGKRLETLKTFVEYFSLTYLVYEELIPEEIKTKYPFWAEISNSLPIQLGIVAIIGLFYSYFSMKESIDEIIIYLQYRLLYDPNEIDIKLGNLKTDSSNTIRIWFKKKFDDNYWIELFAKLRFKLFIKFKWSEGILLQPERLGSEFKTLGHPKPGMLTLVGHLPMNGRHSVSVDISPDIGGSLDDGVISIEIYISPCKLLNTYIKILSNETIINIKN